MIFQLIDLTTMTPLYRYENGSFNVLHAVYLDSIFARVNRLGLDSETIHRRDEADAPTPEVGEEADTR